MVHLNAPAPRAAAPSPRPQRELTPHEKKLAAKFAKNVKAKILARGLTISDLADASAVNFAWLDELLSEKAIPRRKTLSRIAFALECHPDELVPELAADPNQAARDAKIRQNVADNLSALLRSKGLTISDVSEKSRAFRRKDHHKEISSDRLSEETIRRALAAKPINARSLQIIEEALEVPRFFLARDPDERNTYTHGRAPHHGTPPHDAALKILQSCGPDVAAICVSVNNALGVSWHNIRGSNLPRELMPRSKESAESLALSLLSLGCDSAYHTLAKAHSFTIPARTDIAIRWHGANVSFAPTSTGWALKILANAASDTTADQQGSQASPTPAAETGGTKPNTPPALLFDSSHSQAEQLDKEPEQDMTVSSVANRTSAAAPQTAPQPAAAAITAAALGIRFNSMTFQPNADGTFTVQLQTDTSGLAWLLQGAVARTSGPV